MTRENMTFEEDVIDRLARIETNALIVTDHEARLRIVERRQNIQTGAASILGIIGGSMASFILAHFKIG